MWLQKHVITGTVIWIIQFKYWGRYQVLKKVIHIARYNNSERVDFVSDRYPVVSTKNTERINRAASGTKSVMILNGNQKVPRQWKFLNVDQNKEQLVAFLVKQWKLLPPFALEPLNKLFVTCSNYCHNSSYRSWTTQFWSWRSRHTNVLTCTTCLCLHRKYSY